MKIHEYTLRTKDIKDSRRFIFIVLIVSVPYLNNFNETSSILYCLLSMLVFREQMSPNLYDCLQKLSER